MANVDLKTNFKNGDKLYDYELNNNFKAIQAALGAMNKIVWQNDDNASLVMFAGTTEQITNRELIEGQLLYNTQTGETYIDAMVDTELKRISTGGGTSIQIGGIEPTNLATKLWVEDDMLNSLGTEIESGSNENGSYIKFADGTMIQMFATNRTEGVSKNSYVSELVNLPNAFIDNTYIISYNQSWNPSGWADIRDTISSKTKSSFNIEIYNSNSNSDAGLVNYYWIAIGRWKA